MAKPELGTKRVCVSCGARFYDLQKVPAVCPKCATEQPQELPKLRRTGGNVAEEKRVKKAVVTDSDEAEAEPAEDEAEAETEEGVLDDAADLEEDADAIPDEIEVEPEADEAER